MDIVEKNKERNVFVVVGLVFLGFLSLFLKYDFVENLGQITYFYDDAYIHLGVAENFYNNGVPSSDGMSPSNGSSSPFWLLILTFANSIFNKEQMVMVPLGINILTSLGLVFFSIKTLFKLEVVTTFFGGIIAGLTILALVPVLPLTMVGMEHGMQSFLALAFLYYSNEYLQNMENKKTLYIMVVLGALISLTRYEMSLLVVIVAMFLIFKNKRFAGIKEPVVLLVLSATPVILYGFYMQYLGLSFFPDSVVAKGSSGDNMIGVILDTRPEAQLKKMPIIFMLILPYFAHIFTLLMQLRFKISKLFHPRTFLWATSAGVMALFQISFSMPTPVRYDAYLMAIGLIPLIDVTVLIFKRKICTSYIPGAIVLSLVFSLFMISKLALGHVMMIYGSQNIHDQQRETARFVKDFAQAKKVAINDLGMISYYTDSEIYDLEGLGTHEVALMKKNGTFSPSSISNKIETNGTDWVIIYDDWYKDGKYIPDTCIKIGTTILKMNLICGSDKVAFYYCGDDMIKAKEEFSLFSIGLSERTKDRAYAEISR